MLLKIFRNLIWASLIVVISACSQTITQSPDNPEDPLQVAKVFFTQLDNIVTEANVNNAAYAPVDGFPYLRSNRFLASLKNKLVSIEQKTAWAFEMKALDLEARHKEIDNLPDDKVKNLFVSLGLPGPASKERLKERLKYNSDLLFQNELQQLYFFQNLIEAVEVPDDYSLALRTFGLYPLAYLPVAYVTDGAFDRMRAWHQTPLAELKRYGEVKVYALENNRSVVASSTDLTELFEASNIDALGLPRLSNSDRARLAEAFSPIIYQDTAEAYDRIGRVEWDGKSLTTTADQPTLYYYISFAYFQTQPIVQIVYAFYYPKRDGSQVPSMERGNLDGLSYRVSLDPSGKPFMIDIMHNCGCYHFFVPNPDQIKAVIPKSMDFDALVLSQMPREYPEKPIRLNISSGWHQVQHIDTDTSPTETAYYRLRPYDELESLPTRDGINHSAFNPEGIMKTTDRIEPYILFSMGIRDIGALRQRGHHPTKLLGREHFDNPDLFNSNFEFN